MTLLDAQLRVPDVVRMLTRHDEAALAVGAFLARYSGRTFEAYRFDLRTFFQWAEDAGLAVLEAKRTHIELYRSILEER
jgi:site-specific recombinase XerD